MNTEEDYEKIAWNVIDTYFKEHPHYLTRHHIDSYNNFLDNDIYRIFRDNNPIRILKDKNEKTNKYNCEAHLYLGGKNTDKIYFGKPMIYDENNFHIMYPNEARLRNMTYGFTIHYDIDVDFFIEGEEPYSITLKNKLLGRFPIMLHSKLCLLNGLEPEVRYNLGECKHDYGGYFIIEGKEKIIVSQEKFADNMIYLRNKDIDMYSHSAEIRTLSENPSKPKRTLAVRMVAPDTKYKNGQIVVLLPNVRSHIPLFVLMRALGCTSDKDIIQTCLLDIDKYKSYIDTFIPSIHDAGHVYDQYTALKFIATFTKDKTVSAVYDILTNYLLPNVGELNFKSKRYMIGYIVLRLLNLYHGVEPATDRDNFKYKRIELSGQLMSDLFSEYYKAQIKNIELLIDKEYYYHHKSNNYYGKGFINLIENNPNDYFRERIVEDGIKRGMKGDWGSKTYTKRQGISQPLNRLSFYSFISHLRKINLPIDSTAKVVGPRLLHGSQWGIICPHETPDGGSIGFHKHLAISTLVTAHSSKYNMIRWFKNVPSLKFKYLEECNNAELSFMTKIFVNGHWIGSVPDPYYCIDLFKTYRRSGNLPTLYSIYWDTIKNEITIFTDGGRPTRPLWYVLPNDKMKLPKSYIVKELGKSINEVSNYWNKWVNFNQSILRGEKEVCEELGIEYPPTDKSYLNKLKTSFIEYVDTQESEHSLVSSSFNSMKLRDKQYTHMEIHPSLILGVMGNLVVFPENNQAPRDLYGCGQSKQAVSLYHSNYQNRIDKMGVVLNYGQKPLVKTRYMKYIDQEEHPYGENTLVAIMCYNGHNTEDAILINEGAVQRGLFRTTYYSMYEGREESSRVSGTTTDIHFCNIENQHNIVGIKPGLDYSTLDKNGLIKEGTQMTDKKAVIGMCSMSMTQPDRVIDQTITPKKGQLGVVDKTFMTQGDEGFRIAKVRIREDRIPAMGDKFSSRCGQKGTVGLVVPESDMPFTKDGVRPDIIINPHAIPSRMTIGQLIETLYGKLGVYYGLFGNSTSFTQKGNTREIIEKIGDVLLNVGLTNHGNEILYNGYTGEQIQANIFFGPTYYMRLKHMVKDKINYRARGPRTLLTRQTLQGRANDGGLRIGEMERDSLIAHGMSTFLNDSLMKRGDEYYLAICNQTGTIAIYNESKNIFISPMTDGPLKYQGTIHGDIQLEQKTYYGRSFSIVRVPYTFKLLMQELLTMNICMRVITEDNIDHLTSMTEKKDNTFEDVYSTYKSLKPKPKLSSYHIQASRNYITTETIENYEELLTHIREMWNDDILKKRECKNSSYNHYSHIEDKLKNTGSSFKLEHVMNTLNFMYNIMKYGIYVSIRDNEIVKFIPFMNSNYINPFPKKDEFWIDTNIHSSIDEYYKLKNKYVEKINTFYSEDIRPLQEWFVNGPLVGNIKQVQWGDSYFSDILNLLQNTLTHTNEVFNIDLFINKRDGLNMKEHIRTPYQYISYTIDEPYKTNTMAPIMSFATSNHYLDIPIPTPDDMKINLEGIPTLDWDTRKNGVIFRGSATGVGVSPRENQRLKLVQVCSELKREIKDFNIDVGITSWAVRDRLNHNGKMDFIRPLTGDTTLDDKYSTVSFGLSNRMSMEEQMEYKFTFYVDGNSVAYRFLGLLLYGFCIFKIESSLISWFEHELEPMVHYIPIKEDMSDIKEQIEYASNNLDKCRQIALEGRKKAIQILNKIPTYMNDILCMMNTISPS